MGNKVVCLICTKDRYFTTLPLTIESILLQTRLPDKLVIFDDGEHKDLRNDPTWRYFFSLFDKKHIAWEVIFGNRKGQHHGHQIVNKMLGFDFVWRIDDDEVAEPDVLEKLLSHMKDDVGAVAGTVIDPVSNYTTQIITPPNSILGIFTEPNAQWFYSPDTVLDNEVVEVEHLYSSFLYRPNIVNYDLNLSPAAHREETIFSHELFRAGYKLLVDFNVRTWHFRNPEGGIRKAEKWFFEHDERYFLDKMKSWGYLVVVLDNGIGDHFSFKNLLPELYEKYSKMIIMCAYPDAFYDLPKDKQIKLITNNMNQGLREVGVNVYKWMHDNNWKTHIIDAYRKIYL